MQKDKPLLPPDKQPFYHNYHNWVYLKIRQTPEAAEVTFNSTMAWIGSIIVSIVCVGFGVALFLATKSFICLVVTGLTALLLVGINWHICGREASRGPLLRFPKGSGIVELPREGKSCPVGDAVLKLRRYALTDDFGCELILETRKGERHPLTKWLGSDRRLVKLFTSLAQYGLRFEEEDLRGFKMP